MPPPPGDERHASAADDATLPPSVPGATRAGAASPLCPDVPPQLVNHPRYRVLKLLGQGGMGAVYLAEHLVMGRRVALKTINTRYLSDRDAVARFHREVRAAARLAHPHVVAAYDAEQEGDLHFLVMEYVDGLSVADYARRKGPLPVEQACAIVSQAALGLQHAHEQGLVHRDVKPANLMLTRKGQVKVLDFGLTQFARQEDARGDAAQTATGAVLGTADYIAPEQTSSSRKVDIRADVYSLGCTLYYLLAGRVPFPDGTMIDKFIHHATDTPDALASLRPGLPPGLVAIVEKMMAKRPDDRYPTPGDVCRALRPFAGAGRAPVAPGVATAAAVPAAEKTQSLAVSSAATRFARARQADSRRRKVIVAGAVGALVVVGVVVTLLVLGLISSGGGGAGTGAAVAAAAPTQRATEAESHPARAAEWTGQGPTHSLVAPEHTIRNGILDFKDIAGASVKEFRDWQAGLERDGFRVSYLSNRAGVGPPLFNGVAVRDRVPVPVRVFIDLSEEESAKSGDKLKAEKLDLHYTQHAAYGEAGKYRHSQLWAPGGGYFYYGTLGYVEGIVKGNREGQRPCALDYWSSASDDRVYSALGTYEQQGHWEAFYRLTRDEVLASAEVYRAKGWRPDVLAPHFDGERFRFMLVVRENPEPVDWRLQIDMSLQDYKKASAEERARGRFPLAITSYGDETAVKYAALWVRYRVLE